jgi:hypothetical protein
LGVVRRSLVLLTRKLWDLLIVNRGVDSKIHIQQSNKPLVRRLKPSLNDPKNPLLAGEQEPSSPSHSTDAASSVQKTNFPLGTQPTSSLSSLSEYRSLEGKWLVVKKVNSEHGNDRK